MIAREDTRLQVLRRPNRANSRRARRLHAREGRLFDLLGIRGRSGQRGTHRAVGATARKPEGLESDHG